LEIIELRGRLVDELGTKLFFILPYNRKQIFDMPLKGWEECVSRFPEIQSDVIEIGKCFALSRYAATVFHSMQTVEHGLIALGKFIEVKDPKSGWTAVCNELNRVMKPAYGNMTESQKKHFGFLEQILGTIEAMKNAWRNKIDHTAGRLGLITSDFSPDIAEEIMISSRSFMRRLAVELPMGRISD
jgi:hypothetical protein